MFWGRMTHFAFYTLFGLGWLPPPVVTCKLAHYHLDFVVVSCNLGFVEACQRARDVRKHKLDSLLWGAAFVALNRHKDTAGIVR